MNKSTLLVVVMVLGVASLASAQLTPKNSLQCAPPNSSTLSCAASLSLVTGDVVVLEITANGANYLSYTVTDTCGAGGASLSWIQISGGNTYTPMWKTTATTTTASCTVTVARPTGSATDPIFLWVAQSYSGVASVGPASSGQTNGVTACSGSATITSPGNYIVGFFSAGGTNQSITAASSGILRTSVSSTAGGQTLGIVDQTSGTGGQSLSLGVTFAATGNCTRNLVELRGTAVSAASVRCLVPAGAMSCISGPLTVNAGDAIVLFIYQPGSTGSTSVSDSCGQPWRAWPNTTLNVYTVIGATAGSCTITASHGGSLDSRFSFLAKTYSAIGAIGQVQKGVGGNQTAAFTNTVTLTTQDAATNYVVGAIGVNNPVTLSVTTGTQRDQISGPNSAMVIADNISPSPAPVSITFSSSGAGYYLNDVLELRGGTPTGRAAQLNDQTHNVMLTSGANANYTLPNVLLSPNWCTWVMPTGGSTYTYQLVPQSPSTLNGQSSSMVLPYYQMTRVCQDANSNYWASPPFVAGTGIYVLPSPAGVKLSTSPTGLLAPGRGQNGGAGGAGVAEELAELRRKIVRLEREIARLKAGRK